MLTEKELLTYDQDTLEEIENRLEREKVLNDLLYLAREYLDYKDLNDELHGEIAEALKKAPELMNMLFNIPRNHLKSSFITIAWAIQQILRNQNIRIGILNAVDGKAMEFLDEIKAHLMNPKLIKLFPEILYENPERDTTWSAHQIKVKRSKVVAGYTIKVSGITGSITGQHYDIIIFDDVQGDKNSATPILINQVIKKYKECRNVIEPTGIRIIVGTRWMKEDFYRWAIGQNYWTMVKTATVNSYGEPCALDDEDAHPIFPQKFTIAILKEIKREIGTFFYSCQYDNNPLPEESIVFREKYIRFYDPEEEPKYEKIYILCDPALSLSRKDDDTVICIVGQPKEGPLYVRESKGIREDVQGVVDNLFAEYVIQRQVCPEVVVGVEVVAFQKVLQQWIEKDMTQKQVFFKVEELKPAGRKKELRIKALQPMFERGGIFFHPEKCGALIQQLLDYPSSKYDDHPDALSYILDVLVDGAEIQIINYLEPNFGDDPNSLESALYDLQVGGVY